MNLQIVGMQENEGGIPVVLFFQLLDLMIRPWKRNRRWGAHRSEEAGLGLWTRSMCYC